MIVVCTVSVQCMLLLRLSHCNDRQATRVATKMLSMGVQADKLCISANEAEMDEGEGISDSQVLFYAQKVPF